MSAHETYIVGLTGGIACGKTGVARALRDMGQTVLDADAISRALTAPGGEALGAVRSAFGEGIFSADGALNRRALGDIVFANPEKRRALEGILHPMVIARMQSQTKSCGKALVFWDVPLLYETGMDKLCGEVWCAYVSPGEQLRRVMRRDGLTRAQALMRVQSQLALDEKKRRAAHVLNTSGPRNETRRRARGLLRDLQRRLSLE